MKQFVCNTKIISGENALDALKTLNARKVMVVTDPFFMENGTAAAIAQRTGAAQISYFDKVAPDPSVTLAAEGTGALKAFQPDVLIALGGGSAMDCAKAMAYFSGTNAVFVAIPTTSGSGSEVTDFAILTHNGVKHPLVDPRMRPDLAILEASLLEKLPKTLVADTGFDAISHALEAFVATDANAVTDALAKDAFATVLALLFYFVLPFDLEVRQALMILAFAPIGSAVPGFTQELKGDVGLSSAINSVAIVCSIVITVVLLVVML